MNEWSRSWLVSHTRLAEMEALLGARVQFKLDDPGSFYATPNGEIAAGALLHGIPARGESPAECIQDWFRRVDALKPEERLVASGASGRRLQRVGTIWIEEPVESPEPNRG